jgi:hypothetical protein
VARNYTLVFAKALWRRAHVLLGAGLALDTVLVALEHYVGGAMSWPNYVSIVGGVFLIACYQVWLDEYKKRTDLESAP